MIKKPLVSNILRIGWLIPYEERWCHLGSEKFEFGIRCQWKERGGHIWKWYVIVEDQWQVQVWTSWRGPISSVLISSTVKVISECWQMLRSMESKACDLHGKYNQSGRTPSRACCVLLDLDDGMTCPPCHTMNNFPLSFGFSFLCEGLGLKH